AVKRSFNIFNQRGGKIGVYSLLRALLIKRYNFNFRKLSGPEPLIKPYQTIFTCFGMVVGFNRRCCRTEQNISTMQMPQKNRCVACLVARCMLKLLIGYFMLFINNNKS